MPQSRFSRQATTLPGTAGIPFAINFYRPVEEKYDAWTYRVNVDWEPNDHTLFYAGITTGYRAGGFNLANLSDLAIYDQEEITAYEIGWKDQLFDRSLQINASVYYYDYQDIHQSFNGFSTSLGAVVNNVENVPDAEVYGFELDLFWLATDRLALGGNYSFTHSEYTSDIRGFVDVDSDGVPDANPNSPDGQYSRVADIFNSSTPQSLFNPNQVVTDVNGNSILNLQSNIEGNQLLLIPENKWTVFGIYTLPLGNRGELELRTSLAYTDEVFFSIENNPVDKAPDYYRWDARAHLDEPAAQRRRFSVHQ